MMAIGSFLDKTFRNFVNLINFQNTSSTKNFPSSIFGLTVTFLVLLTNLLLRGFELAGFDIRPFLRRCYIGPLPEFVAEIRKYYNTQKDLQDPSRGSVMNGLQQHLNDPSKHLLSCLFEHEFQYLGSIQAHLFASESQPMTRMVQCIYEELSKQLSRAYNDFKIEWAARSAMKMPCDGNKRVKEFESRMLDDKILTRLILPQSVFTSHCLTCCETWLT